MNTQFLDFIHRAPIPEPWAEGEKIPWDDPQFSRRMLNEHLSQVHDAASRRFELIDQHVAWIHKTLLMEKPCRILDLGCGPGLYTSRFARLGHRCVGIDFSPVSIEYARREANEGGLNCTYIQGDIRNTDFGDDYDLAMLIYGEMNVFKPEAMRAILRRVYMALKVSGILLLEPMTFNGVKQVGMSNRTWHAGAHGLFSDLPHLYLYESFWNDTPHVTTERYFVIEGEALSIRSYASSMQAYTDSEFQELLQDCGFGEIWFVPALTGKCIAEQEAFFGLVVRK